MKYASWATAGSAFALPSPPQDLIHLIAVCARNAAIAVVRSLAVFPGLPHDAGLALLKAEHAAGRLCEPPFGALSLAEVQLVPQSTGCLSESLAADLRARYPASRLRLHANVRVLREHRLADLSTWADQTDWFAQAARVHRALGAQAYSAHSGRRRHASIAQLFDNARRCADLFGCPVAIEGQYPTGDGDRPSGGDGDVPGDLLVSTWAEYRQLFESGLPYALDLSHLNILRQRSGRCESTLVAEMLACERCTEVHVSDNDGLRDSHRTCDQNPWWASLLFRCHRHAVVFSEGRQQRPASLADQPRLRPTAQTSDRALKTLALPIEAG